MLNYIFTLAIIFNCFSLYASEPEVLLVANIKNVSSPIICQAKYLIEEHKKAFSGLPIIAITGCSAVGKSAFTRGLQHEFASIGIRASILKQDDFMNCIETIPNYIIHPHLDHNKLHCTINQIKRGLLKISKPKFDWNKKAVISQDLDLTNTDIILFEGTYTLCGKESYGFLDYSDLRIFIYAAEEDIVEWNWTRENSGHTSHTPRTREKFDQDIAWDMRDYREHILPSKIHADFIIDKNRSHKYTLIVD